MIKFRINTKLMRAATMLLLMLLTTTTAWAHEKKTPVVTTHPTASTITYGQLLAGSNYGGKFNAPQMNDDDWDFEEE